MRIILFIGVSLCLLSFSCKKIDKSQVVIIGEGFNKEVKKVYLTDAYKWDVFLDSTTCINGDFKLTYKNSTSFEPFLASLFYVDNKNNRRCFYVRDEVLIRKDGKNHSTNGFMLDYGTTNFKYHSLFNGSLSVNVRGGLEQELYMKYSSGNFGFVPKPKIEGRQIKFDRIKKAIKSNSSSFYFLKKIIDNRLQYSKEELDILLKCFDEDVQHSKRAAILKEHILNSYSRGDPIKPLSLTSSAGTRKDNINITADLNMLIFWASWCGPCRLEIPELKKIREMVKDENFYMASISIDKNDKDWNTALLEEKLNWDQFIVKESEYNKITAQFGFSSIPLVVFTDKKGNELARFTGYSLSHTDNYKKIITDKLRIKFIK